MNRVWNLTQQGLEWANPITRTPSAPLRVTAGLDAYGPSLMPRSSLHQGLATGFAILAAKGVSAAVERATRSVTRGQSSLPIAIGARAVVGGAGFAATRIPKRDDESANVERLRSAGDLVLAASIGGALYDLGNAARRRFPSESGVRPAVVSALATGAVLVAGSRRLQQRRSTIQSWTDDEKRPALASSLGTAQVTVAVGSALGRGFVLSRRALIGYLGTKPTQQLIARALNTAIWGGAGVAAYQAGVSRIGRANDVIEPAYSTPPTSPLISGGPESHAPFEELGQQGRRYVTDVVTRADIEATLGEPAKADPIRVYVGFNTEPLYTSGRAEIALDELERTGAFDRSYLLLISPTGTGWIDQTMIESAELLTRGDIATCAIQYGRYPSFLSLQKIALGRAQFRQLLWGVKQRLAGVPEADRPKVLVFGESLGAWSSSDVVMKQGTAGFDQYGIHRALWVGLPGLAKWSKTGMRKGMNANVEPGSVAAFDNFGQLAALPADDRAKLRAVVLDHDNDPITVIDSALILRRPDWLDGAARGRNVPEKMDWIPVITFVHILADAMNAMKTVPGEFKSFGHDYRADMAAFVHAAYGLEDTTAEQISAVVERLRTMELERGERIREAKVAAEADGGTDSDEDGGTERTKGANWLRSFGSAPATAG